MISVTLAEGYQDRCRSGLCRTGPKPGCIARSSSGRSGRGNSAIVSCLLCTRPISLLCHSMLMIVLVPVNPVVTTQPVIQHRLLGAQQCPLFEVRRQMHKANSSLKPRNVGDQLIQ